MIFGSPHWQEKKQRNNKIKKIYRDLKSSINDVVLKSFDFTFNFTNDLKKLWNFPSFNLLWRHLWTPHFYPESTEFIRRGEFFGIILTDICGICFKKKTEKQQQQPRFLFFVLSPVSTEFITKTDFIWARRKFCALVPINMLVNGQNDVESVNGKVNEFSEDIETVEEILRRYHGDNQLSVIDFQCMPGSKVGDNYMSLIKRIIAKIKTNNNAGECQVTLKWHKERSCKFKRVVLTIFSLKQRNLR